MKYSAYRVLIIEDIIDAQDLLIHYINGRNDLHLSDIAGNGKEALSKLLKNDYDLLFMDINLPFLSGIEVLEAVGKHKKHGYVIFTTAYDQYAVKAFEVGAIDYLLKPFSQERFNQAVDRFYTIAKSNIDTILSLEKSNLLFKVKRKHNIVPFEDIYYIASCGKNTIIHSRLEEFVSSSILKHIENKLSRSCFIRVHKQFIVNSSFISSFQYDSGSQYMIRLKDEDETCLPVGKNYVKVLREFLIQKNITF